MKFCPQCTNRSGVPKRIYASESAAAVKAAAMAADGTPVYVFPCKFGHGFHLTCHVGRDVVAHGMAAAEAR